jgi:hypothetical protein
VLPRVVRTELSAPGFALLPLGQDVTPERFRALLVDLTRELDAAYDQVFGRRLVLYWMGRFSQQRTTEAHLDGAPDESVLVLGYEPSEVASQLFVYDYSRAALDRGLEPKAFLDQFNPTFGEGRAAIEPYRTAVEGFDPRAYNVLVLNNSSAPSDRRSVGMLGVLHQSIVPDPQPEKTRYINMLMLRAGDDLAQWGGCDTDAVSAFVGTAVFQACS